MASASSARHRRHFPGDLGRPLRRGPRISQPPVIIQLSGIRHGRAGPNPESEHQTRVALKLDPRAGTITWRARTTPLTSFPRYPNPEILVTSIFESIYRTFCETMRFWSIFSPEWSKAMSNFEHVHSWVHLLYHYLARNT